eukprot:15761-Heterococcus_DN1.PRE.1
MAAAKAGDLEMLQFMWNSRDGKWPAKRTSSTASRLPKAGLLTETDPDKQTFEEYQASSTTLAANLQHTPGITAEMIAEMQELFNADPNSTRFNQGQRELYTAAALEWLQRHGYTWNADVGYAAYRCGSVPVFELLLQQGCPLDELEGEEAIAHLACEDEHLPALQYCLNFASIALEGRTGWALLANALINDQLCTAQWLKQQGVEWPPRLWMTDSSNVYKLCSVKALEWAIGAGCPWGIWQKGLCEKFVVHSGEYDEVAWAHRHGCPCKCKSDPPLFSSRDKA